jgi:hypothetical protein
VCGLDWCHYLFDIIGRKTNACEHLCRKRSVSLFTHYFFARVILVCHCSYKMFQLCHIYERFISGDVMTYPTTLLAFNSAIVSFLMPSVVAQ